PVNLKAKIPRITAQTIIATLNTTFSFLSVSKWWTRRNRAVPFQACASHSSDKCLLVAHAPTQDLLLCAKYFFVPARTWHVWRINPGCRISRFLVALVPLRDLLFRAKHLFVAAKRACN